ncbi:hypothetical protein KF840_25250 [bacterium]|nr:hypothetical protein [bacterium]
MASARQTATGAAVVAAALLLVSAFARGQTMEYRGALEPPDVMELNGHVGRPAPGERGGWSITLGVGFSSTVYDFHLTGMRILNSGRLPLSVLASLEPYKPTLFVFGHADQRAALAAATPSDTLVITGYRRVGSRTLMLTGLRVQPPVAQAPTPLAIE